MGSEKKTTVVNVHVEPYDVSIMRPSIFGNPSQIGRDGTRAEVIEKFKAYFKWRIENDAIFPCYCSSIVWRENRLLLL